MESRKVWLPLSALTLLLSFCSAGTYYCRDEYDESTAYGKSGEFTHRAGVKIKFNNERVRNTIDLNVPIYTARNQDDNSGNFVDYSYKKTDFGRSRGAYGGDAGDDYGGGDDDGGAGGFGSGAGGFGGGAGGSSGSAGYDGAARYAGAGGLSGSAGYVGAGYRGAGLGGSGYKVRPIGDSPPPIVAVRVGTSVITEVSGLGGSSRGVSGRGDSGDKDRPIGDSPPPKAAGGYGGYQDGYGGIDGKEYIRIYITGAKGREEHSDDEFRRKAHNRGIIFEGPKYRDDSVYGISTYGVGYPNSYSDYAYTHGQTDRRTAGKHSAIVHITLPESKTNRRILGQNYGQIYGINKTRGGPTVYKK